MYYVLQASSRSLPLDFGRGQKQTLMLISVNCRAGRVLTGVIALTPARIMTRIVPEDRAILLQAVAHPTRGTATAFIAQEIALARPGAHLALPRMRLQPTVAEDSRSILELTPRKSVF